MSINNLLLSWEEFQLYRSYFGLSLFALVIDNLNAPSVPTMEGLMATKEVQSQGKLIQLYYGHFGSLQPEM